MSEVNVGIYRITCTANNRQYFGSSCDLKTRAAYHWQRLKVGKHENCHLQADWDRYGPEAFKLEVLIRHNLSKFELQELENTFIHFYWDGQTQCYNIAFDAHGSRQGTTLSAETKARISEAKRGRKHSAETIAKMKGRVVSAETRAKMAASQKARNRAGTDEIRVKMSAIRRARGPVSQETRDKIAKSKLGRALSAEHKARISETKKFQSRSTR